MNEIKMFALDLNRSQQPAGNSSKLGDIFRPFGSDIARQMANRLRIPSSHFTLNSVSVQESNGHPTLE